MPKTSYKPRKCQVCGSNEKSILYKQSFADFSNKNLLNAYDVVTCKKCGFCFSDNIPEQQVFDLYYEKMSKYERTEINLKESTYDLVRFQWITEFLENNYPFKESAIVEIGCATGLLLSALKKAGYTNISGIDPSTECVETVLKVYNIPARHGIISDLSIIESESIDLVILVGVLEHIKDMNLALQEIFKIVKNNGQICIVVPDASQYFNGKDAPFQEFSIEHINFFGPYSLVNLMLINKFSKVIVEQHNFEVNFNTLTPAIIGIFKKDSYLQISIIPDNETVVNLKKYIQNCQEEEKSIKIKIAKIIEEQEPIIIWGTGAQTLRLLSNTDLKNSNITNFVDSNPKYQGNLLNNIPVISTEELKYRNETILISTRAYQNEIEFQIRNVLNLPNKIIKLFA